VITSRKLVDVRYVREDVGWRVHRADTGKVLGHVQGLGDKWYAKASMRAFLGDGAAGGEPLGDWVPPELYAPLRAPEGHDYLPGVHRTRRLAVAALQRYLDEQHAPAMGWPAHEQVRKAS
jgi:hypothetical protein